MAKMTMWRAVKRSWRYLAAKLDAQREEHADPKVQLEQAIQEAREQHNLLTEQAANVIANQRQTQLRLDRAVADYEKADSMARRGLLLADQATRRGDQTKAARLTEDTEVAAARLLTLEKSARDLEQMLLDATQRAEGAKTAVAQSAALLRRKLEEREELLSDLDQAQMQEAMNAAIRQLTSVIGEDVPTFEQVRHKIDARLARSQGMAELTAAEAGMSIDARMLELEQAQKSAEAQERIANMRSEMGLPAVRAIGSGGFEEVG